MISDGRSQSQRQLPALSGDYFHLNEMRLNNSSLSQVNMHA
jgi:hypothetical protein